MEQWKSIAFNERYQISNLGRIKVLPVKSPGTNTSTEHFINGRIAWNGYVRVGLSSSGKTKKFSIHRLIAIAFIPNPKNKKCVNHKNGIRSDNRIENLEWSTHSENSLHGYNSNSRINSLRKLTTGDVKYIRENAIGSISGIKGGNLKVLAKKFNVHVDTIRNVYKNILYNKL